MRLTLTFIFLALVGTAAAPLAGAAPAYDARRAQVAAATADALGSLERDVAGAAITPDLTVEQFVEKTASRDALAKALRRAEQIGGTRWVDDQTCQVRMELPGAEVADALLEIARAKPAEAGLPVDVLRQRTERLRERTFAATGMSTGASERLRPPADRDAWRGVPDEAVQAAVNDARGSAARQVLESIEGVRIPGAAEGAPQASLGTVLADQKVRDALQGWLMNRPVTSVDFRDDLEVRVAVAADAQSFWDELSAATADRNDLPFPQDETTRSELRRQVIGRVEPTVGRAVAKAPAGAVASAVTRTAAAESVDLPRDPPRWVGRQVDARGSSGRVDGRLKTARAAESAARDRLRGQIEELPLSRQLTLGDAARRDERFRAAIDRAVLRARPRKVNYLADGGAEVSFSLDLRELWYDLEGH